MANLFDWKAGKYNALMGKIAERLTPEMGEKLLADPELIGVMVGTLGTRDRKNPFALSVEEQLCRLRQANSEEGWRIGPEIDALAKTAPEWPDGRLAFRSLRIRLGSGTKGVAKTFEAHIGRIESVFGEKFRRWNYLRSDKKHLRLLAGNQTHKPGLEWVVIDLDTHRYRDSIKAVRGPGFLADEGLVFTWMFPEYVQAIDYGENSALFLAGYELNVPESDDVPWQSVSYVNRDVNTGRVNLFACWYSDNGSNYSVPSLRE